MLSASAIVLIITAIFALIGILIIASAIITSRNITSSVPPPPPPPPPIITCTEPGIQQLVPPPPYVRISPKTSCTTPLTNSAPPFSKVDHPVVKLYNMRSITTPVSPNHWLSNQMYGGTLSIFNVYPYLSEIYPERLWFSYPLTGTVFSGATGASDIFYNASYPYGINLSSYQEFPVACDIVDVDPLVSTVVWQYKNPYNLQLGSITCPLAKGCPYITAEIANMGFSLSLDFTPYNVERYLNNYMWKIYIDINQGYVLILSKPVEITLSGNIISTPYYDGVIRIAYYNTIFMFDRLLDFQQTYPVESTIISNTNLVGNVWTVNTTFKWTVKHMENFPIPSGLLMMALPHHNITNILYESFTIINGLLGPTKFVVGTNNEWMLLNTLVDQSFEYPPINDPRMDTVWDNDIAVIYNRAPTETVNWTRWLGSIATLLLIGTMLNKDISSGLTILTTELNYLRSSNGVIDDNNVLVYDRTWNGVIGDLGVNNCAGTTDQGNAFYQSHLGQFGYLVFAYAVASYFDPNFLNANMETALYFVRTIMNPCANDSYFPLWRNKDIYFGFSISSGLIPGQINGKITETIGENIFGYYGCYLLSTLINSPDMQNWSINLLTSEITSLQTYFQYPSSNKFTPVDPTIFVQGTISQQGDSFYNYNITGGDSDYPARNASIISSLVKPLSLMSTDYINTTWALTTKPWLSQAIGASGGVSPDAGAYAMALLAVGSPPQDIEEIIQNILESSTIPLAYGSSWSSILYWVENQ